ncbi:hypothetical protein LA080_005606 [Diaporthe eres]|nr:hypothetical protein LA080_005606 [Diaporthe eres]
MQFSTIVTFLLPLALAQAVTWNLSGTCSADLTCEIDTQYTAPELPEGKLLPLDSSLATDVRTVTAQKDAG